MNKNRNFKIGGNVLIFDGQSLPREGVITKYGLTEIHDTWYVRDQFGERLYLEAYMYHADNAKDRVRLLDAVEQVASDLGKWARSFEIDQEEE